ncbi:MAG: porin [Chthoniobacterales bacterium]
MTHLPLSLRARRSLRIQFAVIASFAFGTVSVAPAAESESERLAKLEAAVAALQQQNTALKEEVAELKKGKASTKPATAQEPRKTEEARPSADGKAVVEKTLEKKALVVTAAGVEAKIALGGFVQGQYEAGDVSAYDGRFPGPLTVKTKDRFRLRRARINLTGDFAEQFDFKLEGDFEVSDEGLNVRDASGRTLANNTNRVTFGATDVFVNWHQLAEANIKLGQFKAPFGLEQLTPDTKLPFIERSQVTEALTPERQIGVQLWGKPFAELWPENKDVLSYSAGIFNGSGRNTTTNDNNEYMYVARVEAQLFAGELAGQDASVKIGGDYFTSRDDRGLNISQTGNLLVGTDGSLSSYVLPSADEREGYGLDGSFHFGPLDLIGEYLDERVSPRDVAHVAPVFKRFRANGYYVAGTFAVIPKMLQLAVKWEEFNPGQVADDDLRSITGGINYYIRGDDLKLMADYIHTWSDFRQSHPQFGDDQFDEILLRMQVMF